MSELVTKFVSMIEALAKDHARLPTQQGLADAMGLGPSIFARVLLEAQQQGLIRVHTRPGGMRRMEVVATGAMTDWNHNPRRKPAVRAQVEVAVSDVQQAKLYLQRRGYPVYAAHVVGGRKGLWIIGSPGREYTDQQLVAFARSRGWRAGEGRAA